MNLIGGLLDLFFPPKCVGCESTGAYLCKTCRGKILFTEQFLNEASKFAINMNRLYVLSYDKNRFLRKLLYKFKYKCIRGVEEVLGDFFVNFFRSDAWQEREKIYFLLVPTSKQRMKERGFFPMKRVLQILCVRLAEDFDFEICDFVKLKKDYKRQQALNREKRFKNVKDIFTLKNEKIKIPEKIVVLDDVLTTGATLNSLAGFLKQVGVKEIIGLVLIKA